MFGSLWYDCNTLVIDIDRFDFFDTRDARGTKGYRTQKNLSGKKINSFDLLPLTFRLKFLIMIG